jgi:hypothetical protein
VLIFHELINFLVLVWLFRREKSAALRAELDKQKKLKELVESKVTKLAFISAAKKCDLTLANVKIMLLHNGS